MSQGAARWWRYAARRRRTNPPKAETFISCSRKDMAFADRPEAALKARGFEVLIDRTDIYDFEDWWERIEALIGVAPAHATAARAVRKRSEIFVEVPRGQSTHVAKPSRTQNRLEYSENDNVPGNFKVHAVAKHRTTMMPANLLLTSACTNSDATIIIKTAVPPLNSATR